VHRLADEGIDFGTFLAGLADMLRAQLAIALGGQPTDVSASAAERLRANSSKFAAGDLLRMLNALSEVEPRFRKSGQQQLLVELLLVRFALFDRTISLEDVLRGLGEDASSDGTGSKSIGSGSAGSTRSTGSSGGGAPDWRAALGGGSSSTTPTAPHSKETENQRLARPTTTPSIPVRSEGGAESGAGDGADDRGLRSRGAVASPPQAPAASRAPSPAARTTSPAASGGMNAMRQAMEAASQESVSGRLTSEQIRAERVDVMRKKDPMLGAAIDALDLELLD
jgi:DNA polymerase-3 subunit gamma/tau